ncbi:MAG: CBS domain-containing protein [Methylococcales bacterium]|jgi:CBS domain-containing protein|nr:CBS domain-containing protein [Methylococcales bacterium]MBT3698880.1 CBS domain-containing protein [Methylococcales bacterium]MBT4031774.1 CBS domain-containing protein [Methylococcales bacterium]MBT4347613.1 CBS domain-containing protein [Methylococcales bacterium]MBT4598816.1 CBS domain-containing protein [Methylococcales bacterium]
MLTKIKVSDYMSTTLVTFTESTNIFEAIKTMVKARITSAPVLNETGQIVGIFSERDCMNIAIDATYNQVMGGSVGEYMSSDVVSIKAESSILEVANQFNGSNIRSFPVYDDNGFVGIISRTDVLRAIAAF